LSSELNVVFDGFPTHVLQPCQLRPFKRMFAQVSGEQRANGARNEAGGRIAVGPECSHKTNVCKVSLRAAKDEF